LLLLWLLLCYWLLLCTQNSACLLVAQATTLASPFLHLPTSFVCPPFTFSTATSVAFGHPSRRQCALLSFILLFDATFIFATFCPRISMTRE
jgi:hypothetical protein